MARTWISIANALRISKPGVEVKTAGPNDLSFNSDRNLPWLWVRQSFAISVGTNSFSFGTTLPELPLVFASWEGSGFRQQFGSGYMTANFDAGTMTSAFQLGVTRTGVQIASAIGGMNLDISVYRIK